MEARERCKVLHETTADTGSDSMFVTLIIRYKNYFVFFNFRVFSHARKYIDSENSRFTVWDFQSVTRTLSALGSVSASLSVRSGRFYCTTCITHITSNVYSGT